MGVSIDDDMWWMIHYQSKSSLMMMKWNVKFWNKCLYFISKFEWKSLSLQLKFSICHDLIQGVHQSIVQTPSEACLRFVNPTLGGLPKIFWNHRDISQSHLPQVTHPRPSTTECTELICHLSNRVIVEPQMWTDITGFGHLIRIIATMIKSIWAENWSRSYKTYVPNEVFVMGKELSSILNRMWAVEKRR